MQGLSPQGIFLGPERVTNLPKVTAVLSWGWDSGLHGPKWESLPTPPSAN